MQKSIIITQKITAHILNGTHKGEEISISNEYTSSQGSESEISQRRHGPFKRFKGKSREIHTFHKAWWLSGIAGRWSVFSSDLYYRKTGILYDHIADIEHNYIRVWISGFYERGKYLKYLQCNCFSIFDNNSDLSEWNPQKNMGFCYFNHMRTVSDHGIIWIFYSVFWRSGLF